MDNRPIGVFDSGMGGLTCVRELRKVLPEEDIVYFGDTGRVPYGTRSPEIVARYAVQDVQFLLSHEVKLIIAACGTVTTTLPEKISGRFPVPYSGVLRPTVEAAAAATRNGKIGVIATATSIRTDAYQQALLRDHPQITVYQKACPLFVPLVENGYFDRENPVAKLVVADYLEELRTIGIDTLILGCTHYPILADVIADYMGDGVALIDSGKAAADYARGLLREQGMLHAPGASGKTSFFVSDAPENFSQNAALFLGTAAVGPVEQVDIAGYSGQIEE